jgi:AAT family amino acid transporter
MATPTSDSDVHVIGHGAHDKDLEGSPIEPGFTINGHHPIVADKLARKLTARQVQMIAIGGTIGTGLFLGTGKSLYVGGPASMLIAYAIVGGIVMLTMLALGEMAAYVPIAGSFCTFAGRYVDDGLGFALTWNYWFNDAVSTAADLVALQLVFAYWDTSIPGWGLSLIFWVFLILANIITVKAYGEVRLVFRLFTKLKLIRTARILVKSSQSDHHYSQCSKRLIFK